MWTPKRVLILLSTLTLFLTGYAVYSYFLGGIDGLPPLPRDYYPSDSSTVEVSNKPPDPGEVYKKLSMAFGPISEELNSKLRPIQFNLSSKGVIISANLSPGDTWIQPDGRVKLSPFSAALFPKKGADGKYPEINTLQSEEALLTMDRPVTNPQEIANRKVIAVELRGSHGITMINNRRTPEKSDDIELLITGSSLFYEESKNLIWTAGFVQVLDTQTQPHPTKITAKGMELQLAKDSTPNRPKTKTQKKPEGVNGVEMLVLHANVDMHLYVDPGTGFMASSQSDHKKQPPASKDAPKKSPENAHIIIKTNGPFHYDFTKDLAWFDSPAQGAGATAFDQVQVTRENKVDGVDKYDQMTGDRLELKFRQKTVKEAGAEASSGDKEIETSLVTMRPGRELSLSMESENLQATGSELFYQAASSPMTGSQTILKGQPMKAVRDGHKIEATEMHLIGADKTGAGQQVLAKGPGRIDLFDKKNAKVPYPTHAVWLDQFTSVKEKEGDQLYDFITLTGNAGFLDEERKQELHAERLQVWMSPNDAKKEPTQNVTPVESKQRIHKIEGFEHVTANSSEFNVRQANHLVVRFSDAPALSGQLPDILPLAALSTAPQDPAKTPGILTVNTPKEQPVLGAPPPLDKSGAPENVMGGKAPEKTKKPIDLTANEIKAYVTNQADKNELQELTAEGTVHVHQEGENAADKGVDILGSMLNLLRNPKGDKLLVFGDAKSPANLQLGELFIVGPIVKIDQADNIAEVQGAGAMDMPSKTKLDNTQTTKPGTRLTVHWNKDMIFNGKYADFHGGVIATQEAADMKCQNLQVTLDKVVSFKEGQKGKQDAQVEKLLGDREVFAQDQDRDPLGKLVKYNSLRSTQLSVDNVTGHTVASGPGTVVHVGNSSDDPGIAPQPNAPPKDRSTAQMMFTRIEFDGSMSSISKADTKNAKFYDNVKVNYTPGDSPNTQVHPDNPPKNGFFLSCDFLNVYTREVNKKTTQMMQAERNVFFRTDEFSGRAHIVKFDESQDHIIFEGNAGSYVTLYQLQGNGVPPREIKGKRILYNRKTGNFEADGVNLLSTSWLGGTEPAAAKLESFAFMPILELRCRAVMSRV